jgi:hypothetical protein
MDAFEVSGVTTTLAPTSTGTGGCSDTCSISTSSSVEFSPGAFLLAGFTSTNGYYGVGNGFTLDSQSIAEYASSEVSSPTNFPASYESFMGGVTTTWAEVGVALQPLTTAATVTAPLSTVTQTVTETATQTVTSVSTTTAPAVTQTTTATVTSTTTASVTQNVTTSIQPPTTTAASPITTTTLLDQLTTTGVNSTSSVTTTPAPEFPSGVVAAVAVVALGVTAYLMRRGDANGLNSRAKQGFPARFD